MKLLNLVFLFVFVACSSTKKTISTSTSEVKKTQIVQKDSGILKTSDSIHLKTDSTEAVTKNDSAFENKTIVEEEFKYIDSAVHIFKRKTTTIQRGKKIAHTSLKTVNYDSLSSKRLDSVVVKNNTVTDSTGATTVYFKDVKRTSFPWWWLWLILILIAAHLTANKIWPGYYKKLFA